MVEKSVSVRSSRIIELGKELIDESLGCFDDVLGTRKSTTLYILDVVPKPFDSLDLYGLLKLV
jgi:hypothetical protein